MKTNLSLYNRPSFTARLFDKDGREIKTFDDIRALEGVNDIAPLGSPNTDVFVKDFISTKDVYGEYDNSIRLGVKNPLFGYQEFDYNLCHKSYSPVKGNDFLEFEHMALLDSYKTNHLRSLEDKALRGALIDKVAENSSRGSWREMVNPVDILDESGMEERLEELGSISAKAAAIRSHLAKSIKQHYDENPAYYDNFSKKIKNALDLYKAQVITESEYLLKMREIMEEYRKGVTDIKYPESIKGNLHAQAFFGVVAAILEPVINMGENFDLIGELSLKIAEIIEKHNAVDWQTNTAIHNKIAQDIDDLFYFYEKEGKLRLDFETIDKIIENVKTVALRRF